MDIIATTGPCLSSIIDVLIPALCSLSERCLGGSLGLLVRSKKGVYFRMFKSSLHRSLLRALEYPEEGNPEFRMRGLLLSVHNLLPLPDFQGEPGKEKLGSFDIHSRLTWCGGQL
jgi:hypothetical protein